MPCIENCIKCSFTLCFQCSDGFTLYANNSCIKCGIGCSECDNILTCNNCIKGYYLSSSDKHYGYCRRCKDNCLSCIEDRCYECKDLYSRSPNDLSECVYCPQEKCEECETNGNCILCELGYGLDKNLDCVIIEMDHCLRVNGNDQCSKCRVGFYLTENPIACLNCVINCNICSEPSKCLTCNHSYYLNSTDSLCYDCHKFGCKACNQANKCLSCYDEHYLNQSDFLCKSCISPCKTCTDQYKCLIYDEKLCPSTTNSTIFNKHKDCDKCLTDKKCKTCVNSLMIPSNIGCKCIDGFFKGPFNNCIKCNNYDISCFKCSSKKLIYDEKLGCVCNEGFYQAEDKDINEIDACVPCEQNCKKCKGFGFCFECKANFFVVENTCFECGSQLPSFYVSAEFLETFTEVRINFKELKGKLKCDQFENYEEKFGMRFKCTVESNSILINLGTKSSLVNETIEIHNFYTEETDSKCNIKVKFEFPENSPKVNAKILASGKILENSEPLKIDGRVSSGRYKNELKYEWKFFSNTSDIQDYNLSTTSYLEIPASKLNKGIIDVTLTVTNKFNFSDTVEKQILCEKDILIVDFNTVSNYSCKPSQNCEFFINKITPNDYNDIIEYSWEIVIGESLLINKIEALNGSSILIKPNSFKPGKVGFIVKVKNQNGIMGLGQIFLKIIKEKPVIVLDRAIGSIFQNLILKLMLPRVRTQV